MKEKIISSINNASAVIEELHSEVPLIESIATAIAMAFSQGNKVLIAGNGGSLCDATHCAEEFVGYFRKQRAALPAIALSEPGYLTCVANDAGFDHVFARGVEALGQKGDIFWALTTSGNSQNLINALHMAKKKGLKTIAFLGKGGGRLRGLADFELMISSANTSDRVQEAHMTAIHVIIEMVEELMFYSNNSVFESLLAQKVP